MFPAHARRRALLWPAAAATAAGLAALGYRFARWEGPVAGPRRLPPLDYPIIDGSRIGPEQLAGQVTLVNFWATSCAVCVAEMPDLARLHEQYRPRGFAVLAIAMPYDRPDHVLDFVRRRALPFPVALDPMGAAVQAWGGVDGTPSSWLVGRDGRVRAFWQGRPDLPRLQAQIESLLALANG